MSDLVITAGITSSDLVTGEGDTVSVTSGGVANSTVVGNGAQLFVYSGGSASGTEIDNGGFEVLNPGATDNGTTVDDGGTLIVLPGGAAIDTTSLAGAHVVSTGAVVVGGGQIISLGDTTGAQVYGGDTEYVLGGGHANATAINPGGQMAVYAGGVASGTIVDLAGQDTIYSGGIASDTTVLFIGEELVSSGGTAISTTVSSGGFQEVHGIASGTIVASGGIQRVFSGGTANNGAVESAGIVSALSGGATTGTELQNGATEYVFSGAIAIGTVVSSGGTLLIHSGSTVDGTVVLSSGAIDLADVSFDSAGTVSFDTVTNTLTVHEGGQTYVEHLSGDYTGEYFHLSRDDFGDTLVTEDGTPCYCRGTLILTDRGEVAVETLRIGDRLITASGDARPIRWIGTRSYSGRFAVGNKDVLPIMIMQDALAEDVPKRDLWVSPLHAMFLDGVLIPAWALVNGASVVQTGRVESVEYFHLELETHDVIVAEGALSETFLDEGSRGMFLNAASYRKIYPDAVPQRPCYCAPRIDDGEALQIACARIAARLDGAARWKMTRA